MTRITIAEALHDSETGFLMVFHHRQVEKFATVSLHVSTKDLIETMNDAMLRRLNKIGKNPSLVSTRGNLESDCKQVLIFYLISLDFLMRSAHIFVQMNAIVSALSAQNEREASADQAETPQLQEDLRKFVTKQTNSKPIHEMLVHQ